MLFNFETGKQITNIPHYADYKRWMSQLSDNDYQKIYDTITDHIEEKLNSNKPVTTSWIAPSIWDNTVYEPLYTACGCNFTHAGYFLGLIVFKMMMDRSENWYFGKFSKNGREIKSLTYFTEKGGN